MHVFHYLLLPISCFSRWTHFVTSSGSDWRLSHGALSSFSNDTISLRRRRLTVKTEFESSQNSWYDSLMQRTDLRQLQQSGKNPPPRWKAVYMLFVLLLMCVLLLSNKIDMDWSLVICLAFCLVPKIITPAEALAGFSNEGLLSALILLIIPAAVLHTGALEWYLSNFIGTPRSVTDAQVRIFIPFSILSAFLNGSALSKSMIHVVQKLADSTGVPLSLLLLPMSYALILGSTCILLGSSTNLIVDGLLITDDVTNAMSIFSLGTYGVPLALIGQMYMFICSQWLLPGHQEKTSTASTGEDAEEERLLLGARLTPQSFASGRTVKQSGLRDNGGIYLVSVYRSATGNIHRAVGQDFLLEEGDVLYFTAFAEEFAQFCDDHDLEILTNEKERQMLQLDPDRRTVNSELSDISETERGEVISAPGRLHRTIGCTKLSLIHATPAMRMRCIYKMLDLIHGISPSTPCLDETEPLVIDRLARVDLLSSEDDPPQIVVHVENDLIIIAINVRDRMALLQNVSECLTRLNLQCRRTEAIVFFLRSVSVWRCESTSTSTENVDIEEIWDALKELLTEAETDASCDRRSDLRVIRAMVTKESCLIGKTASDVNFRAKFNAAIVAIQRRGKNVAGRLAKTSFEAGDILILQASKESSLLLQPSSNSGPNKSEECNGSTERAKLERPFSFGSPCRRAEEHAISKHDVSSVTLRKRPFFGFHKTAIKSEDPSQLVLDNKRERIRVTEPEDSESVREMGRDLQVLSIETGEKKETQSNFLTAMTVPSSSFLAKKSASQAGLTRLAGIVLVSIERPLLNAELKVVKASPRRRFVKTDSSAALKVESVSFDEDLAVGDILWFAGTASSIGDTLRRIPGLVSYESDEVYKLKERIQDRRLVQAVISKQSGLAGKTLTDVNFRTKYGAAVIAINRGGRRLHEHPGKVKLRAGDVLLLEAGPSFIKNKTINDNSFTLLSEVKNSAPPRLRMLIPTLVITLAMILVDAFIVKEIFASAVFASILLVAFGVLSLQEARDAINWALYVTVGSAIGVGTALINSGIASSTANFIVRIGDSIGFGMAGLFGCIYFITVILSYLVSSNVAVALVFPIVKEAASQSGADVVMLSHCVIFASSSCYMTPFSHTANSMIFGLGGYKRIDYIRFGCPLQFILWIGTVVVLSVKVAWYWSWIISAGCYIASVLFIIVVGRCHRRKGNNAS